MLSLLFTICMIWFIGKFFIFGVKASWGILKLLCTVVFFPVILIGMVVGGLIYIAFLIKFKSYFYSILYSKAYYYLILPFFDKSIFPNLSFLLKQPSS